VAPYFGFQPCAWALTRQKLREKYNIEEPASCGTCLDTCGGEAMIKDGVLICCGCGPCLVCQSLRELDLRDRMQPTSSSGNTTVRLGVAAQWTRPPPQCLG
jgi:hypothetical protein